MFFLKTRRGTSLLLFYDVFFSQNEANQSHDAMRCLVSCLHYSELLLWRILDSLSANDILSEIESLIEMPPKKSKLIRKRLSECNAAHRWSAKKVDFAAVTDGESNFIKCLSEVVLRLITGIFL